MFKRPSSRSIGWRFCFSIEAHISYYSFQSIGFGATVTQPHEEAITDSKTMKIAEPEDMVKFGLIPEFIGRFPVQVRGLENGIGPYGFRECSDGCSQGWHTLLRL